MRACEVALFLQRSVVRTFARGSPGNILVENTPHNSRFSFEDRSLALLAGDGIITKGSSACGETLSNAILAAHPTPRVPKTCGATNFT
jgi:hypothetical protein